MINILYFGRPHADYVNDSFLHGILSDDSFNLEEYPTPDTRPLGQWWPEARVNRNTSFMFKDSPLDYSQIYGNGYTLYKLIDKPFPLIPTVDEVNQKISDNYYDLIVVGSIFNVFPSPAWQNNPSGGLGTMFNSPAIVDAIIDEYPRDRVIILEGEDLLPSNNVGFREIIAKYKGVSTFFMLNYLDEFEDDEIHPISVAFPKEKICTNPLDKTHLMCPIIPGQYDTYISDSESRYYATLQQSHFTMSSARAGYDRMCHYDIMFNRSLPYIDYIAHVPKNIMANHRKDLYLEFIGLYDKRRDGLIGDAEFQKQYDKYSDEIFEHAIENHTTEKMIEYIMDTL